MTDPSPYAVSLDTLESGVHIPVEDLVESQPDPAVPHDLTSEDAALGRPPKLYN